MPSSQSIEWPLLFGQCWAIIDFCKGSREWTSRVAVNKLFSLEHSSYSLDPMHLKKLYMNIMNNRGISYQGESYATRAFTRTQKTYSQTKLTLGQLWTPLRRFVRRAISWRVMRWTHFSFNPRGIMRTAKQRRRCATAVVHLSLTIVAIGRTSWQLLLLTKRRIAPSARTFSVWCESWLHIYIYIRYTNVWGTQQLSPRK